MFSKRVKKTASYCSIMLAVFFMCGQAHANPFVDSNKRADRIAEENGFKKRFIKTDKFTLTSYQKISAPGEGLVVYIEGDGRAWRTPRKISKDPTPKNTLVLELAAMDISPNVVYLARPCQYTDRSLEPFYDSKYWTSDRFSEEVVRSMDQAIEEICSDRGASEVHIVGYSGGAAVAALIAARRSDIASFRSIAGNLDPAALNEYHNVSPLKGSLDPLDAAAKLKNIPQEHFIGKQDKVVPGFIAQNFVNAEGAAVNVEIIRVEGASHYKGWKKKWKELGERPKF